jgi:hypothetical protein
MARGHTGFAILNRTANPLVKALLRSPLHGLASGRVALISVTGRRTGRDYTFPVFYRRDGTRVLIVPSAPERKLWWRNLRQPASVRLRLAGEERTGRALAKGDESTGVTVEVTLDPPR